MVFILALKSCSGCNPLSPKDRQLIASLKDPELKNHMASLAKGGKGTIDIPEEAISKAYEEGEGGDEEKTIRIMEFLLSHVRRSAHKACSYEFILVKAISDKREKLIHFLLKQPDINPNAMAKPGGYAAIHEAMIYSSPAVVKALLRQGGAINMLTTSPETLYKQGSTPLHLLLGFKFLEKGNTPEERKEILDILLTQPDINISIKDVDGKTPLQYIEAHKQHIKFYYDVYTPTSCNRRLLFQVGEFLKDAEAKLKKANDNFK